MMLHLFRAGCNVFGSGSRVVMNCCHVFDLRGVTCHHCGVLHVGQLYACSLTTYMPGFGDLLQTQKLVSFQLKCNVLSSAP